MHGVSVRTVSLTSTLLPAKPFVAGAAAAEPLIGSGFAGGSIAASDESINLQVMIPAQVQTSGRRPWDQWL